MGFGQDCWVCDVGELDYLAALSLQRRIVNNILQRAAAQTLLFCSHPPTITLGRLAHQTNILVSDEVLSAQGIKKCFADRGGDVTYHGPGQIVCYPILDLGGRRDLHRYLRDLESCVIDSIGELFGVRAQRREGFTGVWLEDQKIASIGIGVRHWVSYHGFALNLAVNSDHLSFIRSCGLEERVCSVAEFVKSSVDKELIQRAIVGNFARMFDLSMKDVGAKIILENFFH